ncbi:dTDP-4-dehydrorhamnose reductase [Patescibacteria group bacterium]
MKVLLIGKNGLLGSEIDSICKNSGFFEYLSTSKEDLDITDENAVKQILNDYKPNLVVNAAAFTYVDECEMKKEFVMNINGKANGNLAKICNDIGAYLAYFSTDYVFDGTKKEGYTEYDETHPINTYGESKLLGETLIQENTDKFFIIRTSWLFGMHGNNFVKTMLNLAKKGEPIKVVDDQIGKPTYSVDLANAIYNNVQMGYPSGIYHLVNENATTWYDFAKKVFDLADLSNVDLRSIKSDELSRPAKRPKVSTLQNTKLPHLRSHEDALKDYLNLIL